jgi:hypothetical protein
MDYSKEQIEQLLAELTQQRDQFKVRLYFSRDDVRSEWLKLQNSSDSGYGSKRCSTRWTEARCPAARRWMLPWTRSKPDTKKCAK